MDNKRTLSPDTVLDVRLRYLLFKVYNNEEIYYIGPYPRPLANYIRVRLLHHKDRLCEFEREWAPGGCSWVVNTGRANRVRSKYKEYHNTYPIEAIQLQLSGVIAYWHRVCQLLDVMSIPTCMPIGPVDREGDWGYLRFHKGALPYHLGPYPVPVLNTIRKYLKILNLQRLDATGYYELNPTLGIHRNPQLGSTLDTSVTYEMVQEFSRETLLMYYTLYNLTTSNPGG